MDSVRGWSLGTPKHSNRPITLISSVGGFSRPAIDGIRTLQDLFRSIQPLKLQRYEGPQLQDHKFLGEGVTYSVTRSRNIRSGELVAVKTVKLPAAPAPLSAFRSRIECILKDLEVMHHLPLMEHPNIINILGYGWELKGDGPLPFIVTEYASLGTLREYLTTGNSDARSRRELCYHVASGLHELHLSGVAHGDLKLENVLVVFAEPDMARERRFPVLAKLSDFGHSLRFAAGTNLSGQTYHGTIWYNPPEVVEPNTMAGNIAPRKCDMWALGLLCWEVHKLGARYYEDSAIQELLSLAEPQEFSIGTASDGPGSTNVESTKVLCQKLRSISAFLVMEACNWVDKVLIRDKSWQHFDRILLKGVFKNTLQADLPQRMENVSRLPLIHGSNKLRERSMLIEHRAEEAEWTFALFLEEQFTLIPTRVKSEMLTDFERVAFLTNDSTNTPARAALHVVFALTAWFGGSTLDLQALNFWISKSTEGNFTIGILIKELLQKQLCATDPSGPCGTGFYTQFLRLAIRTLARSEFLDLKDVASLDTFAKLRDAVQSKGHESLVAHYAVVHQLTHILPVSYVNIRSSLTGETPLQLACRLGNYQAAQQLLDRGADASISTFDGCLPLHWLFIFDDAHIKLIAPRLLSFNTINKAANRPQIIDAQLPVDFEGSPLAFAVAAASFTAVDVLLDQADAKFDLVTLKEACCRATSLHLEVMLRKLQPVLARLSSDRGDHESYLALDDLLGSSVVIKKILHGNDVHAACDNTARLLVANCLDQREVASQDLASPPSYMESAGDQATPISLLSKLRTPIHGFHTKSTQSSLASIVPREVEEWLLLGLRASVQAGSLRIAQAILRIFEQKRGSIEFAVSSVFGADLSQICAEAACSSIHSSDTSMEILDFAAHHCPRSGFANNWIASVIAAIQHHREDIVLSLLRRPEDLNGQSGKGERIVHTVLRFNFVEVLPLESLLSLGADPSVHDISGLTPLHVAIQLGMIAEIDTLLAYGADVSRADSDHKTPLHYAIEYGRLIVVSRLLQTPAFTLKVLDAGDAYYRSPLALAALNGASEIAKLLIAAGADDTQPDKDQRTPLHLAASRSEPGHLAIIRDFCAKPTPVNLIDCDKNTALHVAIVALASQSSPSIKTCEYLLAAGANPNSKNAKGESCLLLTLQLLGKVLIGALLPVLIRSGANIDVPIQGPYCALHIAALGGQAGLVDILLTNGASSDVMGLGKVGTPLQCCAREAKPPQHIIDMTVSPFVIKGRQTPEVSDSVVEVSRWKAFTYSQESAVTERLISAGANILAKNQKGAILVEQTPLILAVNRQCRSDIAITLTQSHELGLSGPLAVQHLEILQEAFNIDARGVSGSFVHYVLRTRLPLDKSYLCSAVGLRHLIDALQNKEITARYKETQERLFPVKIGTEVLQHLERRHLERRLSPHLILQTNLPSLWADIKASNILRLIPGMFDVGYLELMFPKTWTSKGYSAIESIGWELYIDEVMEKDEQTMFLDPLNVF